LGRREGRARREGAGSEPNERGCGVRVFGWFFGRLVRRAGVENSKREKWGARPWCRAAARG
jgi:hypothetical protein